MIIIDIKNNESIDKALRRYKRKSQQIGVIKELRNRKHFVKPSIERRTERLKAAYRLAKFGE